MKKYIGTKIISAVEMNLIEAETTLGRSVGYQGLVDGDGDALGYLVEYEQRDNMPAYQAWSPDVAFEQAYRPIDSMTFGLAIEALKKGLKVARTGWNGKGMWVTMSCHDGVIVEESQLWSQNNKQFAVEKGGSVVVKPYFTLKSMDDTIDVWHPSVNDCLAEDWTIID
jgi:hypothetical protein